MENANEHQCKRCGYIWTSRVPDPKVCTRCKSHYWKTESRYKAEKKEGER